MDTHALTSRNGYIAEIVKYINEHISTPITLTEISEHVHLSKEYTAKLFKKEMGATTTEFIHETKMKMAKDLIFFDKISLLDISTQLRYFNYSYFTRTFKKFFGYAPAEYRKKVHKA